MRRRVKGLVLALSAALPGAAAHAAWLEARTDHFIVIANDTAANVREQASRLERFDRGFRKLRGLPDVAADHANPITVYVLPNPAAVQKLCSGGRARPCTNVYGFYNGRVTGSIAFMPRRTPYEGKFALTPETVLFHEYSHHIMMANYSGVFPAWFVEGYAEFHSTASFDKDGTVGFGRIAMHRAPGLLLNGGALPIASLLTADGSVLRGTKQEALYGRGWLLTHYLTMDRKRTGQMEAYLQALSAGKTNLKAAELAFGDLKQLDRELNAYLTSRMSYLPLPVPEIPDAAIALRPLTAGEAAMMPVRMQSERGVNDASAALVVADARRLAAPFPDDPGAQVALAEAEFDAGDDDRAEAAADRALRADPKLRRAMLYKGRARLHRAQVARATDAATWREARAWLVKANRAEPNDAAPLFFYYLSFLNEGAKPNASAVQGLERAFELSPQDEGVRFTLARQMLRDDRLADARQVLGPLAFNPHAPADNPAATLVALIDKGDKVAIRAMLDAAPIKPDANDKMG